MRGEGGLAMHNKAAFMFCWLSTPNPPQSVEVPPLCLAATETAQIPLLQLLFLACMP